MDLPSAREIELETLLRQRDAQIGELKDEVTQLRQHLSSQSPSTFPDPISLPPALISLLLPHIHGQSASATATSQTVTTALTQRVKVLQEENDELYELLKTGETGRLKDDVHALKRVVQKLEGALKESHQAIASLSDELEKSQAAIIANARPNNYNPSPHQHQHQHSHQRSQLSHSPVSRSTHSPQNQFSSTNGSKKPVPTGPRAHKKPRLSEQYPSTPHSHSLAPPKMHRSQSSSTRRNESRERSPRGSTDRKTSVKMEIDEDIRPRSRSLERNRDSQRDSQRDTRDREKDRDRDSNKDRERDRVRDRQRTGGRERERERERDRDRDRGRDRDYEKSSRRNGGSVGGGGGSGSGSGRRGQIRTSSSNTYPGGDRTLAERMGL